MIKWFKEDPSIIALIIFILAMLLLLTIDVVHNIRKFNKESAIREFYDNRKCLQDSCNDPIPECREYCYDKFMEGK